MIDDRTFYALKDTDRDGAEFYSSIFPSKMAVTMCMGDPEPIHAVKVRLGDGSSRYWGWWSTRLKSLLGSEERDPGHFTMIFPSRIQVEICFAYGYEAEEKAGNGKLVNLIVEPTGEIHGPQ